MQQTELIGTMLAHSDDETQATVLNEFVTTLTAICKPKDFASTYLQAYCIAKRLRPSTVEFFQEVIASYEHLKTALPAEIARLEEQRDQLRSQVKALQEDMA